MSLRVATADAADIEEIADVAARTFPLACPPSSTPENIAKFIDANLSAQRFAEYLADPDRVVLTAADDGRIIGYAIFIRGVGADSGVQRAVTLRPAAELSKIYVLPDNHGTGVSDALLTAGLVHATQSELASVWLGVNQQNHRAQRFYAKHNFRTCGTRTFRVGDQIENDFVMVRRL